MNLVLPIGSVVKVKGNTKLLMIFGFLQTHPARPDVIFDYIGVPYPEGNLDLRAHVGFQRYDIEEVIHEGYKNEEFEKIKVLMQINEKQAEQ